MTDIVINKTDEITIKLLHYFIVDQGYHPIILQGAKNEIWLENLENDYQIIRIVSDYIHNNDQFDFDIFKTKQIVKKIRKKTFSFNMNTLSIFINLGENVDHQKFKSINNIECVKIKEINDLEKYSIITEYFPTITKKTSFKEKGMALFAKLTKDINSRSQKEAVANEQLFKTKKPIITYSLMIINTILFLLTIFLSNSLFEIDVYVLASNGGLLSNYVKNGEYYRIITNIFLHGGIIHFLFNNYALYIIGPQLETFFGKTKYLFIYLISGIIGSLLTIPFLPSNTVAIGASGAIFGLLGALLYFGYHYRTYLGNVISSQIIPLILLNLFIGFVTPGISNSAHIGGLIGGFFAAKAVGVKFKSNKNDIINGIVILTIFISFLIYIDFIR